MMLGNAPAICSIDVGPPSEVPSIRGGIDVELSQINLAMMMELPRRQAQGKIKPVIDRAMPMSELKAAFVPTGAHAG